MTGFAFYPPQFTLTNSSGRPLAGAVARFFRAGTSTPLTVYTTAALTTPHGSVVTADAAGVFPPIFIDPATGSYKVSFFTSAGSLIRTVDNLPDEYPLTADQVGAALYPRTAAEIAASVVPSNYAYPVGDPRRYGATGDGVTNDAAAVQAALNVLGVTGGTLKLPSGLTFLCTANLNVPVGTATAVDVEGSSWTAGGLKFSGTGVTTGLTFSGSSYTYAGEVRNLRIYCVSGAKRCITFNDVNHPRVTRCALHGAAGSGAYFNLTLMGQLTHTLVISCGSATEAAVEVDNSTTWHWSHSRISNSAVTTQGGLRIDRTPCALIEGGAIESTGTCIRVGSKTETSIDCTPGTITGIDLENPGEGNYYIDFGSGMTVDARCNAWVVEGVTGLPSTTTTVTAAVRLNQCSAHEYTANNWSVPNGTATHILTGTTNLGISIREHRNLYAASGIPWVYQNSAQVVSASPYYDWSSSSVPAGYSPASVPSLSGATPSILISATQGGYYRRAAMANGGATTVTALTGGTAGMEILLYATNGNTTLTHSTSVSDQFLLTGGTNLTMAANVFYHFIHNGTLWVQV